jgi:hypothetical protein
MRKEISSTIFAVLTVSVQALTHLIKHFLSVVKRVVEGEDQRNVSNLYNASSFY